MAVVNVWMIYRLIHGPNSISTKDFGRAVAVSYFEKGHESVSCKADHLVTYSLPKSQKCRSMDKTMSLQKEKNKVGANCNGRPLTYCIKCNVTLCTGCFPSYHKKVENNKLKN